MLAEAWDKHSTVFFLVAVDQRLILEQEFGTHFFSVNPTDFILEHLIQPCIAEFVIRKYFDSPFSVTNKTMVSQRVEFGLDASLFLTLIRG